MANVYDPEQRDKENNTTHSPEQLADAEESGGVDSVNPSSSSTTPGKLKYNTGEPDISSSSPLSSSTAPGGIGYTPAVPKSEQSLYNASPTAPGKTVFGNFFKNRRRRVLIVGGSLATATVTGAVIVFLTLIPAKLLHFMTNIENRFFATSENATEKGVGRFVQGYLKKGVFKALKQCGNTVNKNCRVEIDSKGNFVTRGYRALANAKFEHKLATKYGIEFSYEQSSGAYRLKAPGIRGEGIDITDFADNRVPDLYNSKGFGSSNEFRNALRRQINSAIEGETRYKKVFYRYKVTRLARAKTGLPLCVIACKQRDDFRDWKKDQKNRAYKLAQIHRVLAPRDELTRLVIECMWTKTCELALGPGPQPELDEDGKCMRNCVENGKHMTGLDKNARARIIALAGGPGLSAVTELAKADSLYKEMSQPNYRTKKVVGATLEKLGLAKGKAAANQTADHLVSRSAQALPVIGWIIFLGDITYMYDLLTDHGAQIGYILNSTTYMSSYQTSRVYADEGKEGNIDAAMLGSFNNSYGTTPNSDAGGTAEAEHSPLYSILFAGKKYGPNEAGPADYKCQNGKPVPAGQPVCPEERLDQISRAQELRAKVESTSFTKFDFNLLSGIGKISSDITSTLGGAICDKVGFLCDIIVKAVGKVIGILSHLPLFDDMLDFMSKIFSDIFLPKQSVTLNMSGARKLHADIAGADLLGNETAHVTLGGIKLSQQQANGIAKRQEDSKFAEYKRQPFLAKLFNKESKYSAVSKIAMALPSGDPSSAASKMATSLASNPFGKIFASFSSLFNLHSAQAAQTGAPACGEDSRYVLDTSGNGLYYWDVNVAKVDSHGGSIRASHKEGTYLVFFDQGPGREGQEPGSSDIFTAPDYCDPGGGGDPFGITQYGYPEDNPIFKEDLEDYYQKNCMTIDKTKAWNERAAKNANKITKQPENLPDPKDKYQGTNPCLLIQAVVSSAGALYDDNLLSPEELSEVGGGSNQSSQPIDSSVDISHIFDDSTGVACAPNTKDLGIQDGYHAGQLVKIRICTLPNFPSSSEESNGGYGVKGADGETVVNSRVSGVFYSLVEAAKKDGVTMYANSGFRTMQHQKDLCPCNGVDVAFPGYSNHQMGIAVDFGTSSHSFISQGDPWFNWLKANASKFKILNYPHEAWHWSPTGN